MCEMGVENGDEIKHKEASTSEGTRKKQKEKAETVPFHKLFAFADSTDILFMGAGSIGAIGNGVALPLMALLIGQIIDDFSATKPNSNVLQDVSQMEFSRALGKEVNYEMKVSCWTVTGERQTTRIRGLYLKTVLRQDIAFFDEETNTGEVIGRISGDTILLQDAMGEKVGRFLQLIATCTGGFVIASVKGWLLTVVMLSTFPLLVLSGAAMAFTIERFASRGQTDYAKAARVVEQTIGSIRTVAAFTGEKQAVSSYKTDLAHAYKSGIQEGCIYGVGTGTLLFVTLGTYALGVWFGAKLIMEKGYSGGTVMNVIFSILIGSSSLGQTSPCINAFALGQAAAHKMFQTIERKPQIDAYDPNGKILEDIEGEIELRDVYFSYPSRPEELIFDGFSFHIKSGTTAALVGQSGSGKSTVISLVERFYDPHAGEVLIDGINLKEFQLRWIRGKIGLVSQEPVLFSCSIEDNIAYGKEGATIEEIRSAAELANAAKFIDKLPQGLNTLVGDYGSKLSGGQKQRIAIARAILKNPRILLLDEATSSLDVESERIVQEALNRIMINRTTIVVAHRLSTVKNADTIAIIHKGKMIEKGTHSELLKEDGAYSQLIRLQEINNDSEESADHHSKNEISGESFRQSSQRRSFQRSISRDSSKGNSSTHSYSVSFGLSKGVNVPHSELENSQPKEQAPEVPLSRLASLNKPEIPVLLIGCVAAIANGLVNPIYGLLISMAMKTFYEPFDQMQKDSKFWALMFITVGFAAFLTNVGQGYFFSVAGFKLIHRIRLMCFEKVVNMEVGWFDEPENSSGAISARLFADAALVRALVGDALGLLVQNSASALAGLIIAFTASWQMTLVILVLVPILGFNFYVKMKLLKKFSADVKMMYEEASQVANDAVRSIRTVASFCAEDKVMEMYRKKCENPIKAGRQGGLINGLAFALSLFTLLSFQATGFYAGARVVEAGKAPFSDVLRVFFALILVTAGISQSTSLGPDSSKAKSATASIFRMLDKKSKIDPSDESGITLDSVKGEIELRHVSFKYPSRPDIPIFQDLSLAIHSGKTVALVGESGSGKSTVIALLQRFYDPDSGQITLDGVEIRELQLKWFRQQMGIVSQEPVLFNETIRANIAYGKEGNATEAEVIAATELANAHTYISALQQGYDTLVGERGTQLSGGQKQRVAIARAIIRSPKILLLDEATSALDAESERVVQDALEKVMVNRTTVVVAHRLSTIKNADVIAVVKNGVIVEKGKHEELINVCGGFYASLVQLHTSASTP
ncbi:hypothetical protein ACSQ67_015307 [Phaseolus vulgaris]